jgi:YegS/Rv2252/BmrU family lipid kinase
MSVSMQRRVLVLANPVSGGGRARRAAPELARLLSAAGAAVEVVFTTKQGDARRLTAERRADDTDVIVAVGGDGTLNEVVNGLIDQRIAIAMLPMGTANVLACEFRLPKRPAPLAQAILAGSIREHRIGRAGDRRFALFVGAGFDAAMVEEVERVRTGTLGKIRWVRPVLRVARTLPQHEITVELDDGTIRRDLSEAIVTRVRNFGGVFQLPRAVHDDRELLHVVCFRQRSRWRWLSAATAAAFLGGLRDGKHCEVLRARSVRITAVGPTPYQVDGDFGGRAPVEIELDRQPLRLVVS